jgi:pre-60S factor REI1
LDSHFQSKKHKLAVANPQETVAAPKAAVVDAAHMQPIAEQQRKYAALQKRLRAEYEAAEAAEAKGEAASAHAQGLAAARQELEQQVLSTDSNAMATEADDATPQEAPILELVDCIFDTYRADTFEDNVTYMSETHGFFIPNLEYVVDLEGLFRYLQVKVGNYFTCISCNKNLMDLEGVRRHMADKGHKHIDYSEDGQLEIGEYYDFSSTYPDDSGLTEEDRDADLTVATMAARSGQAYREGYDLVLPSGRRAGHRELQRYYKQHFKPEDQRDSVRIGRIAAQYVIGGKACLHALNDTRSSALVSLCLLLTLRHRYRALGHKGFGLPSELIRKDQLYAQRRIGRNRLDVGVKANKLQHHFREQVLQ